MLTSILMVFGFVCLVIAAFWQPAPARPQFGWLGMAFWCLALLLAGFHLS